MSALPLGPTATRLNILCSKQANAIERKVWSTYKDTHFLPDESIFVLNFGQGDTWLAGIISKPQGPQTYNVKLPDNRVIHHHVDHIRPRSVDPNIQPTDNHDILDDLIPIPTSSD